MLYAIRSDGQYLTKDKSGRLTDKIEHAKLFFSKKTASTYTQGFFDTNRKIRVDYTDGWKNIPYKTLEIVGLEIIPKTVEEQVTDNNSLSGDPTVCQMASMFGS